MSVISKDKLDASRPDERANGTGKGGSIALAGLGGIANFFSRVLGVALIAAVALNFANVVGRYGFNEPLTGVDELQVYLMIGMAFLGGLVAQIR
ncbi:MAG: TRAP transporter small permease subunit, partial [Alphaproteobacteria bacterium]|nr:TRAP transporter small permease subunit [Alphaproteobacteria bacterium]